MSQSRVAAANSPLTRPLPVRELRGEEMEFHCGSGDGGSCSRLGCGANISLNTDFQRSQRRERKYHWNHHLYFITHMHQCDQVFSMKSTKPWQTAPEGVAKLCFIIGWIGISLFFIVVLPMAVFSAYFWSGFGTSSQNHWARFGHDLFGIIVHQLWCYLALPIILLWLGIYLQRKRENIPQP
jgi:hypothetical protein